MIVGILGGTFDPPHLGHLGVAVNVLAANRVDQVWLVPCLTHRFGKAPASFEDRVAMCNLLIANRTNIRVSEAEAALSRPGYTLDLVQKLRADHPDHCFRLIAGQDIYHQKGQWHHYDDIAALAPPVYVARVGEPPIPEPTIAAPMAVSSSEIRQLLADGQSVAGLLPETIIQYIASRNLYAESSHD